MTQRKDGGIPGWWEEAFAEDRHWPREIVQSAMQELLESEMAECLQAGKHERTVTVTEQRSVRRQRR